MILSIRRLNLIFKLLLNFKIYSILQYYLYLAKNINNKNLKRLSTIYVNKTIIYAEYYHSNFTLN